MIKGHTQVFVGQFFLRLRLSDSSELYKIGVLILILKASINDLKPARFISFYSHLKMLISLHLFHTKDQL